MLAGLESELGYGRVLGGDSFGRCEGGERQRVGRVGVVEEGR